MLKAPWLTSRRPSQPSRRPPEAARSTHFDQLSPASTDWWPGKGDEDASRRKDQAVFPPVPGRRLQGHDHAQARDSSRKFHAKAKVDEIFNWTTTKEYQDLNFKREALTINPAKACQPLGSALCCAGLPQDPGVHPRLAGLHRLLPHLLQPPLQGADRHHRRLDDGRRGGVRRAEEHPRRPGQRQGPLRRRDDRDVHHLHRRGDRRRLERLHRQRHARKATSRRTSRSPSPIRRPSSAAMSPAGTTWKKASCATSPSTPWKARSRARTARSTSCRASRPTSATIRVIKRILKEMDVDYTMLSDPEEVLDTPADGEFRMYAGGTTQDEVKDAPERPAPPS